MAEIRPIIWNDRGLTLLDQRLLPGEERYLACSTPGDVFDAIKNMAVRGAPAIGVSAAFAMVLAARIFMQEHTVSREDKGSFSWRPFQEEMQAAAHRLVEARPTAVNLSWGVARMLQKLAALEGLAAPGALLQELEKEAQAIFTEDIETNRAIGKHGAALLAKESTLLTHCNAGALATAGYGTALGVVRSAFAQGKVKKVFADETRPLLQGSRLTCWELQKEGIPVQLIVDGAAGHFLSSGEVDAVITGADRVAANGDAANKIGTYPLALMAREHQIPFYIAAPLSTVDLTIQSGREIVIEERDETEVLACGETALAPAGIRARNPAFDVTPARLVTALITEKGVIHAPDAAKIRQLFEGGV